MKQKSAFIVFEGIDGCGKSTQSKLTANYLKSRCILTREPSDLETGKRIRIALERDKLSEEEWAELFSQDRQEHLAKEVIPALEQGKIVIGDRYYHSTMAYQLKEGEWLTYASRFLKPDLVLIFDLPVQVALQRLEKRYAGKEGHKVFEKRGFLMRVREKFLLMPKYLNENIVIIDSSRTEQVIFGDVKKEVRRLVR